jgi:hypothetical protein
MISSDRSRQSGLIDRIRSIFHSRDQCLMFFSRWMAAMIEPCPEIDQPAHIVLLGEAGHELFAILIGPSNEVVGHAYVKRSTRRAGEDVDPVAHSKTMDCQVKPGNDIFWRGRS